MTPISFLPTNFIPSLDEIIHADHLAGQSGPYNKAAFVEFLRLSHCGENLEFILDVDKYISRFCQAENMPFLDDEAIMENSRLVSFWREIYHTYISRTAPQEVNVPGKLLDVFSAETLP
ncbi:hypothetical protein JCM33374_g4068 [Metschnikowia sp. JCM 33374]|nr:hypothetical protein JCM33374_g4068 [Metschnikowia sp. JCM 33374]